MDIIAVFAAGVVVRLDELILRKPYLILYIEKFRTVDGQQTLIKLWFNLRRDTFVILPEDFSLAFTSSQMARINNKTLYIKLILLGLHISVNSYFSSSMQGELYNVSETRKINIWISE